MAPEDARKPETTPLQKEYREIEGTYRRDVAIIEARPKIVTWAFVLWGMIDVVLLVIFVIAVPTYIVSGSFTDARQAANILTNNANHHALVLGQAPESLSLSSARVLTGQKGTVDFIADVSNPNSTWAVSFAYTFAYDGGETEEFTASLNPRESRPILALHIPVDVTPASAELQVKNISWQRVNRHEVSDIDQFLADHEEFPISGVITASDIAVGSSAFSHTDFTVENRTAFSYWNATFVILLTRGGVPFAVQEASLPQFTAGESRMVSVRWFQPVPAGVGVKIVPAIPFFDPSVYMAPEGE